MNKIVKDTAIYSIGKMLPSLITFILLPLYTNYLTPEEYGIISSMGILQGIVIFFLTLTLERSIYRLYFDYKGVAKKTFLSTVFLLILSISITNTLLLVTILQPVLQKLFISIPFFPYYFYSILISFFNSTTLVLNIYFQVEENPKKFVFLTVSRSLVDIVLRVIFIVVLSTGALGQIYAALIANGIFAIYYIFMSIVNFGVKFDKKIIKSTFKYSLPILPTLLAGWVINLSDRVFIERYLTLTDVGIYSLGYKLGQIVFIVAAGFQVAYNPIFNRVAANKEQSEAQSILGKYNTFFMLALTILAFLVSLFSKEIVILMANKAYHESYLIVPLVSYGYLFNTFTFVNNLPIYFMKKSSVPMWTSVLGAIMNIILNTLFVNIIGSLGAAIATLITFLGMFLISRFFSSRIYEVNTSWKLIINVLLISVSLLMFNHLLSNTVNFNIYIAVKVSLLILSLMFLYLRRGKVKCLIKILLN